MILTTPICTSIPEVHTAGALAWALDTRDGAWASLMDTPIVHITAMVDIMVDIMVVTMVVTMVDTIPTVDTVATMEVTMETTILIPITAMAGWIADIPMDMHIDPRRPLEVPSDPLPETPGTEAVLPHQ